MKKGLVKSVALLAASAFGVAGLSMAPAQADVRSTVIINETSAMTSLNSGTPDTNLVTNSDIGSLTGFGFYYYNDKAALIKNTKFGSYKITKNVAGDFEVTYTVAKGKVWSDGTPINGDDLLLSLILSSSDYSKKAGLGDPNDSNATPTFNSGGYGGTVDNHVNANAFNLSDDGMSVTVTYDSYQPDWQVLGPGPAPVHALVLMAGGKKSLQKTSVNISAKGKFESAFFAATDTPSSDGYDADTTAWAKGLLAKIGNVWSNLYNVTDINSSTNPLLLLSNGGFIIQSAVDSQSVTLVRNDKYNSGPAMVTSNPINTVVFKFVADGTPAVQALANGDIDIYDGQPTTAAYQQLTGLSGATTLVAPTMTFEHVDLRVGVSNSLTATQSADAGATYNGPFAGTGAKATDLRKAFLLALPRQAIANKEVLQIFDPGSTSNATVLNSSFLLPAQKAYAGLVKSSGIAALTAGTQADRTAQALALVKKYYSTASASNSVVDIHMTFKGNQRRIDENALIAAEEAKAGFNVSRVSDSAWSKHLNYNDRDVAIFAWAPSAISQTGTNSNFLSDGSNNHYGWNFPAMDAALHALETDSTDAAANAHILAAEKIINSNALTAPLYQWPQVIAYNKAIQGISPAPLVPNVVWNYFTWHY
jgi:peptide/nickel transport system substrate-binding protein